MRWPTISRWRGERPWAPMLPWLTATMFLIVCSWKWAPRLVVWLLYGLVSFLIQILGSEMWYGIYKVTGFLCLFTGALLFLFQVGSLWSSKLSQEQASRKRMVVALCGVAMLGSFLFCANFMYRHGFLVGPRNYPQKLTWGWGMQMSDGSVPYLSDKDATTLRRLVFGVADGVEAPIVEIPRTGDSLLLAPVLAPEASVLFRLRTNMKSHVTVYHLSRYIPGWVQKVILKDLEAAGVDIDRPDYVRDETEKWYVFPSPPRDTERAPP